MSDIFVGIPEEKTLVNEPQFSNPVANFLLSIAAVKGVSPLVDVLQGTKPPTWKADFDWLFSDKGELALFRDAWRARMGGLRGFWIPSWQNDLRIGRNIAAANTYVDIVSNGFINLYNNYSNLTSPFTGGSLINRWGIMLVEKELDTKYFRLVKYPNGVQADSPTPGLTRINYEAETGKQTSLGKNIAASDVTLISLMFWVTTIQQNLPMTFHTDGVVSCSMSVEEAHYEAEINI